MKCKKQNKLNTKTKNNVQKAKQNETQEAKEDEFSQCFTGCRRQEHGADASSAVHDNEELEEGVGFYHWV